jgi:hypothetical protein
MAHWHGLLVWEHGTNEERVRALQARMEQSDALWHELREAARNAMEVGTGNDAESEGATTPAATDDEGAVGDGDSEGDIGDALSSTAVPASTWMPLSTSEGEEGADEVASSLPSTASLAPGFVYWVLRDAFSGRFRTFQVAEFLTFTEVAASFGQTWFGNVLLYEHPSDSSPGSLTSMTCSGLSGTRPGTAR